MTRFLIIASSRSGHNFVMNQIRSWFPHELAMINWENMDPKYYSHNVEKYTGAGLIDPDDHLVPVIVLRDLLNWWASYLKFVGKRSYKNYNNVFNAWVGMAREVKHQTVCHVPNAIPIYYDRFRESRWHRQGICDLLGGMYSEELLNVVALPGEGSSFDKYNLPGNKLRTDTRYKLMQEDPVWWDLLRANPEAVSIYEKHFPQTDEQEEILKQL